MTKVMWLGEDSGDVAGPSFTTCYGLRFAKGEPVELTDPDALRRAKGNLQFKVIEQEDSHGESQTQDKDEDKREDKEKDQRENRSGYSPVKKKVRKKKVHERPQDLADAATTT